MFLKKSFLRLVCLRVFDSLWINHLAEMDYLRNRVSLRAYGQLDPLVEYKNEGFKMFQQLLREIEAGIVQTTLNLSLKQPEAPAGQPIQQTGISGKGISAPGTSAVSAPSSQEHFSGKKKKPGRL